MLLMSSAVLDASALLALVNLEEGSKQVAELVAVGATISAVNLSEVVAKLSLVGMPEPADSGESRSDQLLALGHHAEGLSLCPVLSGGDHSRSKNLATSLL